MHTHTLCVCVCVCVLLHLECAHLRFQGLACRAALRAVDSPHLVHSRDQVVRKCAAALFALAHASSEIGSAISAHWRGLQDARASSRGAIVVHARNAHTYIPFWRAALRDELLQRRPAPAAVLQL